jgi:tetratricopeptide (TPR) repeat protein
MFDSPSDAVACAAAIQRAAERHNRNGGDRLDVRIGVQVGEDVGGDDSLAHGAPRGAELEANRLCDAALGGQILVSGLVYALAAPHGARLFQPMGLLELRGAPEPMQCFEVVDVEPPAEQIPLPPELGPHRARRSVFVGRRSEWEQLRAAWQGAEGGERRIAFIVGEPGIGKTRLAAEFALETHTAGATVLWGRSFEEALVPYQPFVQALRHYVAHADADELRTQLGPNAAPFARLVPEAESRLPGVLDGFREDPENERYRLFEAISTLLVEVAAAGPLVLTLDDLQWADEGTLLLLRSVAIDPRPAPILVVGTYRDSEVSRRHPLAQVQADIARDRVYDVVDLSGLVEEDVASLVDAMIGWEPPPDVAHSLQAETEGNPFFVEEVVRHLEGLGVADDPERLRAMRETVEELGVPKRVRELVGARLQRLSPDALEALSVASIVGTEFQLDVLAEVLRVTEDELVERMDEAVEGRLVVEAPGRIGHYGFSHALIQQALYEDHTANRRASLHARVAEAIEALHPEAVAGLAHHYSLAGERATRKVLAYARAAGEQALDLLAYEQAVREFSRALGALATVAGDDVAMRADLLVMLGTARTRAGDAPAAQASFAEAARIAREIGDGATLARAALGYGGGAGFGGVWVRFHAVDETLVGFLEDALAACPAGDERTRARLLARLAEALYWSPEKERVLALSEEALDAARRLDDPTALAYALDSRHVALWGPDHLDELRGLAEEMLLLGEQLSDRDIQLEAYAWLITDSLERDPMETVDRYIEGHARIAWELRQPYHLWYTQVTKAMRAHLAGRFDEALQLTEEALGHGAQAHGENAIQAYLVQQLMIRLDQDTLDDLVEGLEAHVATSPLPAWKAALALVYGALDRRENALAQVEFFAGGGFTEVPRDCVWSTTLGSLARVVSQFDFDVYAQPLYDLLLPFEDRNTVVGGAVLCLGPISRLLGMLARVTGDCERALAHLEAALERSRALESPPQVARTLYETARVLVDRNSEGDAEEATRLLREATSTAGAIGMHRVVADAHALEEAAARLVAETAAR